MTTNKHIVQIHPVENGVTNLDKVLTEGEFLTVEEADRWIESYNALFKGRETTRAVYLGRVNDATGELE